PGITLWSLSCQLVSTLLQRLDADTLDFEQVVHRGEWSVFLAILHDSPSLRRTNTDHPLLQRSLICRVDVQFTGVGGSTCDCRRCIALRCDSNLGVAEAQRTQHQKQRGNSNAKHHEHSLSSVR